LCVLTATIPSRAKLIHQWPFEEGAAATVAADPVGGLQGILHGPVSVAGKVGNALSFDGSNDTVEVKDFVAPMQGTVALWLNPSLAKSKERFLGTGGDFELWVRSNGELKNELFDNGSTTLGTGAGAVKKNEWQHVAFTYDGTAKTVEIYLNGESKAAGSANLPAVPTGTTLQFGWRPGAAAAEYYKGLLDEIQIYDEVLPAGKIKQLFENPGATAGTATTKASGPSPAAEATEVPPDVVLTWTAGLHSEGLSPRHRVFFGTDFNDVNNALAPTLQNAERYPADGNLDLELGRTYYWRVDEANAVTGWDAGDIWSFTVASYLIVDDFEDYNDFEPHRVFDVWWDGWSDPTTNGSIVGANSPPYTEQTIVHGGKQSLRFQYANGGPAKYSEAFGYIDDLQCPRDWTARGVKILSLWVHGRPLGVGLAGNQVEPMYVAVSNTNGRTATVYNTDPQVTVTDAWVPWTIELKLFSDQGVDLTSISKLAIGFGDKNRPQLGGAGVMYFDDLRLCPPAPTP